MGLELIDVLDTVVRNDGMLVDVCLMSDGNVHWSPPYDEPCEDYNYVLSDCPF